MSDQQETRIGIHDLLDDKREAILQLASKRGAYNVRVFGSVARGEARPDSDVDFLVDFKPGYRLLDHVGLMVDLQNLLGRKVDVAVAANLREELRPYILQDAVPILNKP